MFNVQEFFQKYKYESCNMYVKFKVYKRIIIDKHYTIKIINQSLHVINNWLNVNWCYSQITYLTTLQKSNLFMVYYANIIFNKDTNIW